MTTSTSSGTLDPIRHLPSLIAHDAHDSSLPTMTDRVDDICPRRLDSYILSTLAGPDRARRLEPILSTVTGRVMTPVQLRADAHIL